MTMPPTTQTLAAACVALNQTVLDWSGNMRRITEGLDAARRAGARLVCFPELSITGYGAEDLFLAPWFERRAQELLAELVPRTKGIAAAVGTPVLYEGRIYNGIALMVDGALVGISLKQNLARDGIHYEPRWFSAWPKGKESQIVFAGVRCPVGDLVFDLAGVRIGFEICEDAWVQERTAESLARRGVQVVLNPSASHFSFGKALARRALVCDAARAFKVTYLYANMLGCEAGRTIYDGHCMIAESDGRLHEGQRCSFSESVLLCARVSVGAEQPQTLSGVSSGCRSGFSVTVPEPADAPAALHELGKHREFSDAMTLGLFDYLRKSRHCGFALSLSGGADSSALVVLIVGMVWRACAELGLEGCKARFAHWGALHACRTVEQVTSAMLVCVYQATQNSSEITLTAARELCHSLGVRFLSWDVEPLVAGYVSLVSGALGRDLGWERDDAALQNIQARVRSPGIWMIANIERRLLLATANRSEASVGYATMDGDTSGGLAPLGGVDKAYLREWLRWREFNSPEGHSPIAALRLVNQQAPTAELRPPTAHQTDEADLMPYRVLNRIEIAAIRERLSPRETLTAVSAEMSEYSRDELVRWVVRFYKLWSASQWKRERLAPAFHLDDHNVDPRSWCRFPILSGGYEEELEALAV